MRRSKSSGVGTRARLRVEAYVIGVQSANRRRITLGYVFTCRLIKLKHAMLNIKMLVLNVKGITTEIKERRKERKN